jgi:hypothetical protein
MKSNSKSKLRLDRETVLVLSGSELAHVAGGKARPDAEAQKGGFSQGCIRTCFFCTNETTKTFEAARLEQ